MLKWGALALCVLANACSDDDGRAALPETLGTMSTSSGAAASSGPLGSTTGGGTSSSDGPLPSTSSADTSSANGTTELGEASTAGSVLPECVSDDVSIDLTVGAGSEFSKVALPLEAGTEYGYLRAEVEFVFGDDNGTCFNPAAGGNQNEFPVFQVLLALKRGSHWCKGGSAYSITTQGSGSGPFIAGTFYKEEVFDGRGCGRAGIEQQIFNQTHALVPGGTYTAIVTYDRDASTLSVEMNGQTYSGSVHPDVHIVGSEIDPWHLVMSFDGGYLGCLGEPGDDRCCHIPSLTWQYNRLTYEACPSAPG